MAAILHPRSDAALRHRPNTDRPGLRLVEGRSPCRTPSVYRRRRLVAALLMVAVLVLALSAGRAALRAVRSAAPAAGAVSTVGPSNGPVVIVQAGDTLWGIARRLTPHGDIRPVVDRLVAAHGNGPLQPGERLPVGEVVGR